MTPGTKRRLINMAPVEQIRGKFAQAKDKNVRMFIGTGRRWRTTNMWAFKINARSTAVKPSETAQRQKFASVQSSTIDRMHDITTLAQDQRAFRAQSKYPTFHGFIFHLEWDAYQGE